MQVETAHLDQDRINVDSSAQESKDILLQEGLLTEGSLDQPLGAEQEIQPPAREQVLPEDKGPEGNTLVEPTESQMPPTDPVGVSQVAGEEEEEKKEGE